ncbi:MAG: hypothetical protein ABSG94_08700 [Brevinematales bacterium]
MRIAIAGGMGFEKELLEGLKGHKILLVGSCYDLKREKFFNPDSGVEFIGEFLTRGYEAFFSDYDIFIDVSESLKSKFIMNDLSVKFGKKYISLFFDGLWKLGVFMPGFSCLECFMEYKNPGPSFLVPMLSFPLDACLSKIIEAVDKDDTVSFCTELQNGDISIVGLSASCKTSGGLYRFLGGEMDDVVAVSCSDQSVAVTPMEEIKLDLDFYRIVLKGEAKIIAQNTFYLEFKIFNLNVLLFRHGRLIVKGTKEKNTALAIYRRFIGN